MGISQPIIEAWNIFALKKNFAPWKGFFALWISRCEIPAQLCIACLLMAITYSFQIQIMHRLKNWILDFPSFKMIYHINNLSSRKCLKNVSNSSEIFALEFARWTEFRTLNCGVRNFRTLFRTMKKLAWGVQNGTRVPGGGFARCENFRTLD